MNVERRNPPLISIVIPNLNGINYLPGCLSSIREQTFKEFEVIVVDNGSTDGSVEFIKAGFPQTLIIENRENRGFAAANNQGIKVAKGEYIATLNNDTEADRDWLANLYNAAVSSNERTGMWAPKILSLERRDRIDSVGGLLLYRDGIAKGRGRLEKDTGQYDKARDILIPSACCALYSKKML
ncbi:MAG: glycosyltransferase family 2 protein, partial [Thermodesulfovibrionia bacterium]|nr:glycosyltransferase family 2 protein [Thermodesulfovibrionia bacterium]